MEKLHIMIDNIVKINVAWVKYKIVCTLCTSYFRAKKEVMKIALVEIQTHDNKRDASS